MRLTSQSVTRANKLAITAKIRWPAEKQRRVAEENPTLRMFLWPSLASILRRRTTPGFSLSDEDVPAIA